MKNERQNNNFLLPPEDLRMINNALKLGSYSWDLENEKLIWSGEMYEIYELDPNLPPSFDLAVSRMHPADRYIMQDAMALTWQMKAPPAIEFRLLLEDNRIKYLRSAAIPFYRDGKLIRMIGTLQDITEEKKMAAQLLHSEKLQALGQLASGVAHDFNNQISCIRGFTELLMDDDYTEEDKNQFLQEILAAVDRSNRLAAQLLTFSRKKQANKEEINIHNMLEQAADLIRHRNTGKVQVVTDLNAEHFIVSGDSSQLENAILNLGVNAVDSIEDNGKVTIKTSDTILDEEYCLNSNSYLVPGEYIRIEVCDNGTGIPYEIQSQIFEPFFTTKQQGKGTGIGLAAVYGTVNKHMGLLKLNSAPGSGSCFSILLPVISTSKPEQIRKSSPEELKDRVLLISHDAAMIRNCSRILAELKFGVSVFTDPEQAYKYFCSNYSSLDFILIDLVLPTLNGRDLYERMKTINPEVKAVLTVTSENLPDTNEISGFQRIISKPVQFSDLSEALSRTPIHG